MSNTVKINLVDRSGRKYLNAAERRRFIDTACAAPVPAVQIFALTLVYTGCRISEALALRYCDVDINNACLRFKTLKRRREVWREVPVPPDFVRAIELVHSVRAIELVHSVRAVQSRSRGVNRRLWTFNRATASRYVKGLMTGADIKGPQASAKGLRHAFGVAAVESGVPLPTIAAVLGHAQITTTAIYTTAVGTEARTFLSRMWM